jgi:hypothetical protein
MSKLYSTEELIQILAQERKACINGERLNLAAMPSGINPLLDRFVNADGIQRFTAFNDFRNTVHHYQQEHQVSGIVWHHLMIRGKTLCYPKIHEHLVSLPSDLGVLHAEMGSIVEFWRDVTQGMEFFLSMNGGKNYAPMSLRDIDRILQRTEWATLFQQGKGESLEIILQLGWGKPEEAIYRRGFPESGSEYIHAVQPGRMPIG